MSSSQWKDPAAGRRHASRQEEHGKTARDHSERAGEAYSSRSGREPRLDPFESLRSDSTSRPEGTTSARPSALLSSGRRGSAPTHRKELVDRSETGQGSRPISVYKDSSRYRDADVDHHRDEREPRSSGGFGSPTRSRGRHWDEQEPRRSGFGSPFDSRDDRVSDSRGSESYDNSDPRVSRDILRRSDIDSLEDDFGDMSIDPRATDREYTISSSAPAPRGHWPPSSSGTTRPPVILERNSRRDFKDGDTRDLVIPLDPYDDKRKEVTNDIQDSQSSQTGNRHVGGTPGLVEKLDSSYKVRNRDYKTFFTTGKIFSTLWTDPYAEPTNASDNDQFLTRVTYVAYNERVHSKIRRFIVVKYKNRCCTCLPVTTYGGIGPQKRGINLNEHGLVYSGEVYPRNEEGIYKEPLRAELVKGSRELVSSYINYGRPYTVETNVKVKEVGDLDANSRRLLMKYYNEQNIAFDDEVIGPVPNQLRQGRVVEFSAMSGGTEGYGRDSNNYAFPAAAGPANRSSRGSYGSNLMPDVSNYNSQGGRDSWNHNSMRPAPDTGHGGQFNASRDSAGSYFPPNPYSNYQSIGTGAPLTYHSNAPGPLYPVDRPVHQSDQTQYTYPTRYDSFPQSQYNNSQDYNSNSFSATTGPPIVTNPNYRTEDSHGFPRDTHVSGASYGTSSHRYPPEQSQHRDSRNPTSRSYHESDPLDDESEIHLATLEESKAEKERRMSFSSSGRSHGSSRRNRDHRDRK